MSHPASFSSFATPPSTYKYDLITGKSTLLRQAKVKFDPANYEVKQQALDAAFDTALQPKKLVLIPGNHFTPYNEEFALTGNEARDWFTRHLKVGGSVALN